MKYLLRQIILFIYLLLIISARSQAEIFNFDSYSHILKRYVTEKGLVDYSGLKTEEYKIDIIAEKLAKLSYKEFLKSPESYRLAFYCNVYNIFTIKAVLEHYPFENYKRLTNRFPERSIRQIPGVWKRKDFILFGENISLDHIEHDILRKRFSEPRIHLAINCASMGCPPLLNEPYSASELETQFKNQIIRIKDDPNKFKINTEDKLVRISKLFKWFSGDFTEKFQEGPVAYRKKGIRSVLNMFYPYLNSEEKALLRSGDYRVLFLEYSWSLNESSGD